MSGDMPVCAYNVYHISYSVYDSVCVLGKNSTQIKIVALKTTVSPSSNGRSTGRTAGRLSALWSAQSRNEY